MQKDWLGKDLASSAPPAGHANGASSCRAQWKSIGSSVANWNWSRHLGVKCLGQSGLKLKKHIRLRQCKESFSRKNGPTQAGLMKCVKFQGQEAEILEYFYLTGPDCLALLTHETTSSIIQLSLIKLHEINDSFLILISNHIIVKAYKIISFHTHLISNWNKIIRYHENKNNK